jgi:asparagine synthase (glutamine-hydrolysing)
MCGISGFIVPRLPADAERILQRLGDALHHRGPDDRGYFLDRDAGVGFAHNRLSILDLTPAGHQPMLSADGRIALLYNGEVYNFQALRRELETKGHVFRSRCDTEVVLRAYEAWGAACVRRFCGMFALAVWDGRSRELLLARDPMGMKPLYYAADPPGLKGFYFASELKAFRALPGFEARMSPVALRSFLEFGYTFDAQATTYQGVQKLPPGHVLHVRGGQVGTPEPYFVPPCRPAAAHDLDIAAERTRLLTTLSTVVDEHMVADVPVGILLSGGLDSSFVAALAARHSRVTTVTMGFEGSTLDERPYAAGVARHIGSEHHEILIAPRDVHGALAETVGVFDDLFDDWGTISTRLLYLRCRAMGIKVVLVGEGSDEIFGGYGTFREAPALRGPQAWRLLKLWHCYGNRRYGWTLLPFARLMRGFLRESDGDWFHSVRLFESRYQLPNNYVMKVDKASMSVSVEARAPFLDRRVAEIAYSLPSEVLQKEGVYNKAILREAALESGLLPSATCMRPKVGGAIAMNWMDDDPVFREFSRSVVLDSAAEWTDRLGLRGAMQDYFDRGRQGYPMPRALSLFRVLAWRLMQLNLWSQVYLSGESPKERTGVSTDCLPSPNGLLPRGSALSVACTGASSAGSSDSAGAGVLPESSGLVSVIIPVYNRADLVRRAMQTVLDQSYRPLEVILVDDGSTDGSAAVLEALAAAHSDIARVVHKANGGPGLARETGRQQARGEFIQYLDSDDELLPTKFELQVAALRAQPECDACYGPTITRDVQGKTDPAPRKRTGERIRSMFPAFLGERVWDTSTPLFRRVAVAAAGPWKQLSSEEDWEYDCRVAALGTTLAWVAAPVSITHLGAPGGLSSRGATRAGMVDRAVAYRSILESAERAAVPASTPERQHFARAAFLLARQCGAAGLIQQSRDLVHLAARADPDRLARSATFRLYAAMARLLGWGLAGRLACAIR